MSRLEEMKQELQEYMESYKQLRANLFTFEESVEYVKLNELLDYIGTYRYKADTEDLNNECLGVPVVAAEGKVVRGYSEISDVFIATRDEGVILFDDFYPSFRWFDEPFSVFHYETGILTPRDTNKYEFVMKYVYYAMRTIKFRASHNKPVWFDEHSHRKIPLPSIEVQKSIVDRLDEFNDYEHYYDWGLPRRIELLEYAIKAKEERR